MRRLTSILLLGLVVRVLVGPVAAEDCEVTVDTPEVQFVPSGHIPSVTLSAVNVTDITITVRRLPTMHEDVQAADRQAPVERRARLHLGRSLTGDDFSATSQVALPISADGAYYYRIDGGHGHYAEGLVCVTASTAAASKNIQTSR